MLDRTPRKAHRLNLTPLIDIIFLLVVFFMVSSQFQQEHLLPMQLGMFSKTENIKKKKEDYLLIELLSDNRLRVKGRHYALHDMASILEKEKDDIHVLITPHKKSHLQNLVTVIENLQHLGVEQASLFEQEVR